MPKKPDDKPDKPEPDKPLPDGLRAEDFARAAGQVEFEADTLAGDVRDLLLTHMRAMKVPWSMLNESEQADKIEAAMQCGKDVVRRLVQAISRAGFPSVVVSIGAVKFDKGVEVKVAAANSVENILRLAEHGKQAAVLVLAESNRFYGARAAQVPDKDQPELSL